MSIFAMGVMPYISASIIIQMLGMVVPTLMEYRKEGEAGRRKTTQLTRYATVGLALFQSFGAAVALQNGGMVLNPGMQWLLVATVTMTTGTMFLMWLGEQITERGVGNGISMIILVGHRRRACPGALEPHLRIGQQRRDAAGCSRSRWWRSCSA